MIKFRGMSRRLQYIIATIIYFICWNFVDIHYYGNVGHKMWDELGSGIGVMALNIVMGATLSTYIIERDELGVKFFNFIIWLVANGGAIYFAIASGFEPSFIWPIFIIFIWQFYLHIKEIDFKKINDYLKD